MDLIIDLSDRKAVLSTYADCRKWREKGRILRAAAQTAPKDPTGYLPDYPWHTMLELGCGLEQWIQGAIDKAAANATVYACDLSEDVLRLFSNEFDAFSESRRLAIECCCVVGDGEHLPFAASTFDCMTAVFVGHHVGTATDFVRELVRTLKPDGWLLTNSVDWSFPPPDFPSQAIQKVLGKPARFRVLNAFDESSARSALTQLFGEVRERRQTIHSVFTSVDPLIKLHLRLEHFIKHSLHSDQQWADYLSCVRGIVEEYIQLHGSYAIDLPITYFLCERPQVSSA
jgi:SAM-dependent methyltransferase